MTVGEMKKALEQFPDDLPMCVPDANEEHLYPTLVKGLVIVYGEWCNDQTPDNGANRFDHLSNFVEVSW